MNGSFLLRRMHKDKTFVKKWAFLVNVFFCAIRFAIKRTNMSKEWVHCLLFYFSTLSNGLHLEDIFDFANTRLGRVYHRTGANCFRISHGAGRQGGYRLARRAVRRPKPPFGSVRRHGQQRRRRIGDCALCVVLFFRRVPFHSGV